MLPEGLSPVTRGFSTPVDALSAGVSLILPYRAAITRVELVADSEGYPKMHRNFFSVLFFSLCIFVVKLFRVMFAALTSFLFRCVTFGDYELGIVLAAGDSEQTLAACSSWTVPSLGM